jgi:hypothetical protein
MTNSSNQDSCWELFKFLSVLQLQSQYILSIFVFVVMNKNVLTFNSEVCNVNTSHGISLTFSPVKSDTISKGSLLPWN